MGLKEKIGAALELPDDLVEDVAKVTVIGKKEVSIENYKGIIEYSSDRVRVGCNGYQLTITGNDLEMKIATGEVLFINGTVKSLEWLF